MGIIEKEKRAVWKSHVVTSSEVVLIFQINLVRMRMVTIKSVPNHDMIQTSHLFILLGPLININNFSTKLLHIFTRLIPGLFFFLSYFLHLIFWATNAASPVIHLLYYFVKKPYF